MKRRKKIMETTVHKKYEQRQKNYVLDKVNKGVTKYTKNNKVKTDETKTRCSYFVLFFSVSEFRMKFERIVNITVFRIPFRLFRAKDETRWPSKQLENE